MSEINFQNLQKEVCSPESEPPPLKKLCAPCIPNQSYIEPDWEFVEIAEPYFNEKKCEYQITLTINKFGDSFSAREFRNLTGRQQDFQDRESLLRSFIHPAIVLILEDKGKLVADQIICASAPTNIMADGAESTIAKFDSFESAFVELAEQEVDQNRVRCPDFGTASLRGSKIDPSEPFDFNNTIITAASNPEIKNPFALELYANVNDFYIDPIEDMLKVHIGIPSFIVDQVPELPSAQELREEAVQTRESVVLNVEELFGQIKRLESSLVLFGKYQSYFYQTQDGFLRFSESKKDFYANRISSKIGKFYSDLKNLGEKNGMNFRSNIPSISKLNVDKIRIEFKNGPSGNPYVIKSIYAWKDGCEEKRLRKGIKAFKKTYDKKPTVMNYVAKIKDIDLTLQARETTPWLDFLVKFTYPLIVVDYGLLNMQSVGDTLGRCVEDNVRDFGGELRDYILNESLSFLDSLSFQYSSVSSCEELFSTENQPEVKEFENISFGLEEGLSARRKTRESQDSSSDDIESLGNEVFELSRRLSLMKLEREKLEGERSKAEKNVELGLSTITEVQDLDKMIMAIKKSELEVTVQESRLSAKLRTLRGEDGESIQRSKEKKQRKAAAKIARRKAKSHPYSKKAAKIALEEIQKKDSLLATLVDWEEYEKTGGVTFNSFKNKKEDKDNLKSLTKRLSICTLNSLTINAIRCIYSGVTKERAFDKMFRAAMQSMDLDVFGFFIGGLPPNKQADLRDKFEKQFGNIPLPWESNYDPGNSNQNEYKKYLSSSNVREKNTLRKKIKDLESEIQVLEDQASSLSQTNSARLQEIDSELERNNNFLLGEDDGVLTPIFKENVLKKNSALEEEKKGIQAKTSEIDNALKEVKSSLEKSQSELQSLTGLGDSFNELSDSEKRNLIVQQQKGQGTFGSALGNIQEEIVNAYIDYVFDVLNYEEIGSALNSVPGGTLVFNTLDQIFKCSTQGLFNPPIKSFLSSLSLDVCGPTAHVGIAFPSKVKEIEIPTFSKAFFLTKLKNMFIDKIETTITKVITMLLLKLFETADNALCKSLNAISQFAAAQLTGAPNAGLDQAFADAFCPDANEEELDNVKKNAFGNALGRGAAPDSAYECLFKAVNGTMSKREIINLLTNTPNNMDDQIASKFAALVNSRCPELADILGETEDVKDAFGTMGRYIPPELKNYLRAQNEQDLEAPIYEAICLTQDELDLWNSNRRQVYLDNGLDEDTADELINKANDRALDNLGSLSDMLQKGPEGLLGEALDALLSQADPACANDPSAIIMEEETLAQDKQDLFNDYFKRIEKTFLNDLIGERNSLLGNILIDTEGNHLQQHSRRTRIGDRTFLFANYVDSLEQWEERKENAGWLQDKVMDSGDEQGMFPETVGLQMLQELESQTLEYKTSKDNPQIKLSFSDSDDPDYESTVAYKLIHNKKSTKRIFTRETRSKKFLGKKFDEDTELITSSKVNSFSKKQSSLVNYEFFPNEVKIFSDLIKRSAGSTTPLKNSATLSLFDNLNSKILKSIRDAISQTPSGQTPAGFNFGFDEQQAVGYKDLLYVDPTADPNDESTWKYSFREEDGVLGKSATENPRVYFLDPVVHGGRFKAPKIYIEPATYDGWLGAIKTFVPQIQTCDDKDNGFLDMTNIAKRVKNVESNLPLDKRLNQPLECRLEVPYDRQLMPANHGMIEGIVLSTIRMYAAEFIIRTFPIHGSIQFSKLNVDKLVTTAIADKMQREMSEAGIFSNISRLAYYLLFLEQSVQVVQRQIIDGLMKETEDIKEASKVIQKAQNNYEKLRLLDFLNGSSIDEEIISQLSKGASIMAFGNKWNEKTVTDLQKLRKLNGYKINLARKVAVIHETQAAAEVFLAALIEKETEILSKKINLNLRPLPHVFDIKKYMLSSNGILEKSNIKSGLSSVEQEIIEGSSKPDYGEILSCAGSDLSSPLNGLAKTLEDINKEGLMYLEKYIRLITKEGDVQVVTVSEFQSMVGNRSAYDENLKISDYFGNARIDSDGKLSGTIGVKFGVRLIFCAPKQLGVESQINSVTERLANTVRLEEGSVGLEHIPLVSYELDILDKKIKDIDLQDSNLGEDIKCYVDRLTEQEDFELLFETIFKTKSFVSLFSIYSYDNFIESIGKLEVEDEKRQRKINQAWKKKIFNDTKRLLRKQFRSVYNSQDDTSGERSSANRTSNINFLKNLIPDVYLNISGVGFLQRLRIVEANPFDENGDACVNEFQKIFEDD